MRKEIVIYGSIIVNAIHKVESVTYMPDNNLVVYLVRCYASESDPSCHEYSGSFNYSGGNIYDEAVSHLSEQ